MLSVGRWYNLYSTLVMCVVCWQMASVNAVYKIYVDGTFLGRDALKVSM